LGFFHGEEVGNDRVLTANVLAPLAALRPARCDKRTYGHVFLLGGSRSYPGAILMSVLAALRSGAGLVTAFVPESLVPAYAARAPEAMWVGWPETPAGGLALEGEHLLKTRMERAGALVIGPGLAREAETLALVKGIVENSPVPLVIDADALQPDIVRAGSAARIVTPHAGEFARIRENVRSEPETIVVLKGPVTRVWSGAGFQPALEAVEGGLKARPTYHSFFGGPVLARGGSGDILSGLVGGLLAQSAEEPLLAAARGVVWHGLAADLLARNHGQTAVQVTQLLDFLGAALKECAHEQ
jgi:NAD(P)H-hydrate epimerase